MISYEELGEEFKYHLVRLSKVCTSIFVGWGLGTCSGSIIFS